MSDEHHQSGQQDIEMQDGQQMVEINEEGEHVEMGDQEMTEEGGQEVSDLVQQYHIQSDHGQKTEDILTSFTTTEDGTILLSADSMHLQDDAATQEFFEEIIGSATGDQGQVQYQHQVQKTEDILQHFTTTEDGTIVLSESSGDMNNQIQIHGEGEGGEEEGGEEVEEEEEEVEEDGGNHHQEYFEDIIEQEHDEGGQQQVVLDAQSLQSLIQGGNFTLATSSGGGGKQNLFLTSSAPSIKTPQLSAPSKSPVKILPAPAPAGDQQGVRQRILLKQGNVLTSISNMSQISQGAGGGSGGKYIQVSAGGGTSGQPRTVQYVRLMPNNNKGAGGGGTGITTSKIAIAPNRPKPVAPKPSGEYNNIQGSNYVVAMPNYVVKSEHSNSPVPIRPAEQNLESSLGHSTAASIQQQAQQQQNMDSFRSLLEPNGMRPRKPCNCTKSQCLKLYCDCFANGEFCHLCNCTNCSNNLNHEEERQKAIKLVLERNPGAFRPKIGKSSQTGEAHERRHNKGCNCRRSGCLKNYCECYEAKIFCSGICKCTGCKNCIENIPTGLPNGVGVEQHFAGAGTSHRQTLKDLAEAAEVRVQQQTQVKNKMRAQMQDISPQNNLGIMVPPLVFRNPQGSISYDVVTSTVELLIAKGESAEKQKLPEGEIERLILEEFGDCLGAVMELGSNIVDSDFFNNR